MKEGRGEEKEKKRGEAAVATERQRGEAAVTAEKKNTEIIEEK